MWVLLGLMREREPAAGGQSSWDASHSCHRKWYRVGAFLMPLHTLNWMLGSNSKPNRLEITAFQHGKWNPFILVQSKREAQWAPVILSWVWWVFTQTPPSHQSSDQWHGYVQWVPRNHRILIFIRVELLMKPNPCTLIFITNFNLSSWIFHTYLMIMLGSSFFSRKKKETTNYLDPVTILISLKYATISALFYHIRLHACRPHVECYQYVFFFGVAQHQTITGLAHSNLHSWWAMTGPIGRLGRGAGPPHEPIHQVG